MEPPLIVSDPEYGKFLSLTATGKVLNCHFGVVRSDTAVAFSCRSSPSQYLTCQITPEMAVVRKEIDCMIRFSPLDRRTFNDLRSPYHLKLDVAFIPIEEYKSVVHESHILEIIKRASARQFGIVFLPRTLAKDAQTIVLSDFLISTTINEHVCEFHAGSHDVICAHRCLTDVYSVLLNRFIRYELSLEKERRTTKRRHLRGSKLKDVASPTSVALTRSIERHLLNTDTDIPTPLESIVESPVEQADVALTSLDSTSFDRSDAPEPSDVSEEREIAQTKGRKVRRRRSIAHEHRKTGLSKSTVLSELDTAHSRIALPDGRFLDPTAKAGAAARLLHVVRPPIRELLTTKTGLLALDSYKLFLEHFREDLLAWDEHDLTKRISMTIAVTEFAAFPILCPNCRNPTSHRFLLCTQCGCAIGCCASCADRFAPFHRAECGIFTTLFLLRSLNNTALHAAIKAPYDDVFREKPRQAFESSTLGAVIHQNQEVLDLFLDEAKVVVDKVDAYLEKGFFDKTFISEQIAQDHLQPEVTSLMGKAALDSLQDDASVEHLLNSFQNSHIISAVDSLQAERNETSQTKEIETLQSMLNDADHILTESGTGIALDTKINEILGYILEMDDLIPETVTRAIIQLRQIYATKLIELRQMILSVEEEALAVDYEVQLSCKAATDKVTEFLRIIQLLPILPLPNFLSASKEDDATIPIISFAALVDETDHDHQTPNARLKILCDELSAYCPPGVAMIGRILKRTVEDWRITNSDARLSDMDMQTAQEICSFIEAKSAEIGDTLEMFQSEVRTMQENVQALTKKRNILASSHEHHMAQNMSLLSQLEAREAKRIGTYLSTSVLPKDAKELTSQRRGYGHATISNYQLQCLFGVTPAQAGRILRAIPEAVLNGLSSRPGVYNSSGSSLYFLTATGERIEALPVFIRNGIYYTKSTASSSPQGSLPVSRASSFAYSRRGSIVERPRFSMKSPIIDVPPQILCNNGVSIKEQSPPHVELIGRPGIGNEDEDIAYISATTMGINISPNEFRLSRPSSGSIPPSSTLEMPEEGEIRRSHSAPHGRPSIPRYAVPITRKPVIHRSPISYRSVTTLTLEQAMKNVNETIRLASSRLAESITDHDDRLRLLSQGVTDISYRLLDLCESVPESSKLYYGLMQIRTKIFRVLGKRLFGDLQNTIEGLEAQEGMDGGRDNCISTIHVMELLGLVHDAWETGNCSSIARLTGTREFVIPYVLRAYIRTWLKVKDGYDGLLRRIDNRVHRSLRHSNSLLNTTKMYPSDIGCANTPASFPSSSQLPAVMFAHREKAPQYMLAIMDMLAELDTLPPQVN
ncbi:hypothetical protein GMRT_16317 [Giardia muris]|uniref:Uncharacterized protein n=1 Tax=Giardia muris TaxID=5742 RepID=A0A4Z1T6H4_GIAMU|nr:hypothetical protein GMRT_16317 [Giardia muris]|eukprot:TNJ29663.1 hypothetical protein GMRT_16317 [Giardia muris]